MNRNLLISGVCSVFGVCLVVAHKAGKTPAVASADQGSRSSMKDRPSFRSFPSARAARSPAEVTRAHLLKELAGIVRSGKASDPGSYSILLTKLAQMDPVAAAAFATSLDAGPWREEALQRVSQTWASMDAASAERWAASLTDELERQATLTNVCLELAQGGAEPAVKLAERYGLGTGSGSLMEALAQQWAGQDFSAAMAWVISKPADDRRERMITRLAFVQAETQPAEAARLALQEIPDGPVQAEAVISVIYQWARRDLVSASDWAASFPEGPLRERALAEITNISTQQSD